MKRLLAVVLAITLLLSTLPAFAKTVDSLKSPQNEFRAFFYDSFDDNSFLNNPDDSIDDIFSYANKHAFRAVFIKVATSGKSIFPSRFLNNVAGTDALKSIINKAKSAGVKVYAVIDVQNLDGGTVSNRLSGWTVDGKWNLSVPQVQNFITAYTKELAKYAVDGIVADNFWYSSADVNDSTALSLYSSSEANTHRLNATNTLVHSMRNAVKNTNKNIYFGIGVPDVCVNRSTDETGSKTYGKEAVSDNFFDVRSFIKYDLVDFVSPHMSHAITDDDYNYLNIIEWYTDEVSGTEVSVIPFLKPNLIGTDPRFDKFEIMNQIQINRNVDSLGHVLCDYHSLKNTDVMETLAQVYDLSSVFDITTDLTLTNRLNVQVPATKTTTVYYDKYYVAGTCDPKQPLYLNGEKVPNVGNAGVFGILLDLEVGENYFTFTQGENSTTITIVRKSSTSTNYTSKLSSIFPTYDDFAYAGEELILTCIGPSGAYVTAEFQGSTYTMEQEVPAETGIAVKFYARVTAIPYAKSNETTKLGKVKYTMYFNGAYASYTSIGNVFYVGENSRAAVVCIEDQGLGTLYKKPNTDSDVVSYIYTGVKEYVIGSSGNFFILQSGGYIPKASVDPVTGVVNLKNTTSGGRLSVYDDYEKITLDTSRQSAFTAKLTDDKFTFTLYNTQEIANLDISNSRVFATQNVEKKDNCVTYSFSLKEAKGLWGYHVEYLENKTTITFKYPPKLSSNHEKPLEGVTVVIDPGHGNEDPGALGPAGSEGAAEKDLNMAVSAQLKLELEKLGAKVYMTRTTDVRLDYQGRLGFSDAIKPDFFISIHHNSTALTADSSKAEGFEIYYHWSRSKKFAQNLYDGVMANTVREGRDIHYADYRVTRMYYAPSVLVECGFMLNPTEYSQLIDPFFISNTAVGLAQGVLESVRQNE